MLLVIIKTLVAALLITGVSWLSDKKTSLAGFLTALPLTTLIALVYSQLEWKDSEQTIEYAKSVFWAIPLSLTFFIPFFLAKKFEYGFWVSYISGVILLGVGYLVHDRYLG